MILTPKNWNSFQHYKDRAPSWIKLHKGLLDDFDFCCLPVASRALAPFLWLLASEYDDGKITASLDALAFRLRMTRGELADALSPLIESGFFHASEPLAECKQDAIPEREEEKEDIEKRERREDTREVALSSDFDDLWAEYPNKVGKKDAQRAYVKARKSGHDQETIGDGLRSYIRTKPPDRSWLNLATFFNGQRWNDRPASIAKPLTAHQHKQAEGREILNDIGEFISRGSSQANPRILRHDPGDQPQGIRGGAGGNLIELSPSRTGTGD